MKKYNIILADPPWEYKKSGGVKNGRGMAKSHYNTMKLKDIKGLDVQSLCDKNCYLFMWVTSVHLKEGLEVLESWGFDYVNVAFTWIKMNKDNKNSLFWGMGNFTRANSEFVLLGRKGKLERKSLNVHSVVMSPVRNHSQKPLEVYSRIERLYGDVSRIELFARHRREGWGVFGDQAPSEIQKLL